MPTLRFNLHKFAVTELCRAGCALSAAMSLILFVPSDMRLAPTQTESLNRPASSLIVPGKSVGSVELGDPRDTVLKYFPFKPNMDNEHKWTDARLRIHWLDFRDNQWYGEVNFAIRDGRVFQIESATPKFHTAETITLLTAPEKVKRYYRNLKAYVLENSGGEEVGGRDLIYWVCQEKGIAFELSYYPDRKERLVYKVIVFEPGTEFQPNGSFVEPPQKWTEVPPYSLEPPKNTH